jgi:hypothetical protein
MSVATLSSYVDLPFAVSAAGAHLVFTFTLPATPFSLDLPNPWYVNSLELTIMRDRLNANIVYLGDSQGVIAVNFTLSSSPSPAGGFAAWILLLLAVVPAGPITSNTNNVFVATRTTDQVIPQFTNATIIYNNVISTSTDVTHNAGTGAFTANTTGDYQITGHVLINPQKAAYFGLSIPAGTAPLDLYGFTYIQAGGILPGTPTQFAVTHNFTAGDTFSLTVNNASAGAATILGLTEPGMNYVSVKRVPTLLT